MIIVGISIWVMALLGFGLHWLATSSSSPFTRGRFVHRVEKSKKPHQCRPPHGYDGEIDERWLMDWPWFMPEVGDIWECNCGRQWIVTRPYSSLTWAPHNKVRP